MTGDIVGDDDIFDDVPLGNSWSWDDEMYGYSAQMSGLTFHDNIVRLSIKAGRAGSPATLSWEPPSSYVTWQNSTQSMPAGTRLEYEYSRERGSNHVTVLSRVPAGTTDRESIAVHNPTRYFVHVLREVLMAAGITIGGSAVDVDDLTTKPDYGALTRLASHTSPALADIAAIINKESQNLFAEQVLRTLGTVHPVDDEDIDPGSTPMGVAAAMETFAAASIDTSRLQLVDGSGLSRKNLVTPRMTTQLLTYMASHSDLRRAAVVCAFTGHWRHRRDPGVPVQDR